MRYEVGDRVRIKSIDWYYDNRDRIDEVACGNTNFIPDMTKYCKEIVTISAVLPALKVYHIKEDGGMFNWTDEMIEGLAEDETKPKFKVGDKIKLKSTLLNDIFGVIGYESDGYRITNILNGLTYFMSYSIEHCYELVEEETKPKFKVGDKVILDPYPCVVTDVHWRDSLHGFVYTVRGLDFGKMVGEEDLIFDTSEEETPKFKVNDIVFVKNIGWVRITNSYWDSLANEYIYEAIGFNGEGEYDSINQSNIEGQMLPESENPHTGGNKITLDEYKNNDKEWLFNKLAMLDNITALESIQDIFNHLQQSKYPKTYEECCGVLGVSEFEYNHTGTKMWYRHKLMATLDNLMLCRDAYWKLYGEENGLGKPWEPDFTDKYSKSYVITAASGIIHTTWTNKQSYILAFPSEEMRDVFYENFKREIEICKELL